MMMRTIVVKGKANLSVAPDTNIINLEFKAVRDTYDAARELSISINNEVISIAKSIGLAAEDVKTISYDIESEYKLVKENDLWNNIFIGYKFSHRMQIQFDIDADRLGRIIKDLDRCEVKPEVSISYTVKDPESAKDSLLTLAVQSSRRRAEVMAAAVGLKLGEVMSIDYSWSEMRIMDERYNSSYMCDCEESSLAMNFTPEDIDLSDSVSIVWELDK